MLDRGAEGGADLAVGAGVGLAARGAVGHRRPAVGAEHAQQAGDVEADDLLERLGGVGDVLLGEQLLEVVLAARPLVEAVQVDERHARHLEARPPERPELHRRVEKVLLLVVLRRRLDLVDRERAVREALEHVDADLDPAVGEGGLVDHRRAGGERGRVSATASSCRLGSSLMSRPGGLPAASRRLSQRSRACSPTSSPVANSAWVKASTSARGASVRTSSQT